MGQYLIDIFSDSSDQARLVTTLIAAFIAVSIVLLNQWFNSRRARKDKIIEKIEEVYSTLAKIQELNVAIYKENINLLTLNKELKNTYFSSKTSGGNKIQSKLNEMHDEYMRQIYTAEMLSGLYFPSLANRIEYRASCKTLAVE